MQNIEKDQGAFDETVLEVLGLEASLFASSCMANSIKNDGLPGCGARR